MSLTGPEQGAPLVPDVDIVGGIERVINDLHESATACGRSLEVSWRVLTERARLMRLTRGGNQSCNRSCRLLEARDGWIALNLSRVEDRELLLPWLGIAASADPWPCVAERIGRLERSELVAMADGLPLPLAMLGESAPDVVMSQLTVSAPLEWTADAPPLVVDLSALWAGPLCGQLLRQAGARVIKVESMARLEPMRRLWPQMFEQLHAGKESLTLDLGSQNGRRCLLELLRRADIVISSARPRAFEQMGIDVHELLDCNSQLAWIAITAHGWHGPAAQRVGFGDDAAVAGGLVASAGDGRPVFVADAIADPLTGMRAATAALRARAAGGGGLLDISLSDTARQLASARRLTHAERGEVRRRGDQWWLHVADRATPVATPQVTARTDFELH
jgi:CoA-transferase family III